MLQLQNEELSSLNTKNSHTLQLYGLEGRHVDSIVQQDYVQGHNEKSKNLNKLDEAFGFMCIHISREIIFHLDGLKTPREVGMKF